jgi:hypothetical protein
MFLQVGSSGSIRLDLHADSIALRRERTRERVAAEKGDLPHNRCIRHLPLHAAANHRIGRPRGRCIRFDPMGCRRSRVQNSEGLLGKRFRSDCLAARIGRATSLVNSQSDSTSQFRAAEQRNGTRGEHLANPGGIELRPGIGRTVEWLAAYYGFCQCRPTACRPSCCRSGDRTNSHHSSGQACPRRGDFLTTQLQG